MTRLLILWVTRCKGTCRTVPGSSIIETVVSLTILLTILTLSFTRIDRINQSVNPQVLYKAHLLTGQVIIREDLMIEDKGEYEIDGFLVKKSMGLMENGLYQIELQVFYSTGKLLYTRKILRSHRIEL